MGSNKLLELLEQPTSFRVVKDLGNKFFLTKNSQITLLLKNLHNNVGETFASLH